MKTDLYALLQGRSPYAVMAAAGITPASSMAEVNEAGYTLIERGMTAEERAAWDALRRPELRLTIDFWLAFADDGGRP